MIQLFKTYPFEAARRLSEGSSHLCRLHGHSFQLTLFQEAPPSATLSWRSLDQPMLPLLEQLNYHYLNETLSLSNPTDSELLHWCQRQLGPGFSALSLRSTHHDSAEWNMAGTQLLRTVDLHSAHFLPHVYEGHKCGRLHGHNFKIILKWDPSLSPKVTDASALLSHFNNLYQKVHHKLLNKILGLDNPTAENLSTWLWHSFKSQFSPLCSVTVFETASAGGTYAGDLWDCFKEFSLDSAIHSAEDPIGHTYRIRLHLRGSLDEKMGWIRDFADVKSEFKPYFMQLDHHHLEDVDQLRSSHLPDITQWIFNKLSSRLPELWKIQIWETDDYGVIHTLE